MCLAIPGEIVEIYHQGDLPMGKVRFGGLVKEACLAFTPEAQVGDYVVVHVGFAISRLDQTEAEEVFSYLEQIEPSPGAEGSPGASGGDAEAAGGKPRTAETEEKDSR